VEQDRLPRRPDEVRVRARAGERTRVLPEHRHHAVAPHVDVRHAEAEHRVLDDAAHRSAPGLESIRARALVASRRAADRSREAFRRHPLDPPAVVVVADGALALAHAAQDGPYARGALAAVRCRPLARQVRGDLRAVLPRRDEVALAGHDVAAPVDVFEAVDLAVLPVGEAEELAVHRQPLDRLRDRSDGGDDELRVDLALRARNDHRLAALVEVRAAHAEAGQPIAARDEPHRSGQRLDPEEILALGLLEDAPADLLDLLKLLRRRLLRPLRERHVLDAPPVVQRATPEPEVLVLEAVARQGLRDPVDLHLDQVDVDAAGLQASRYALELQHLDDVDRRQAAADHRRVVVDLVGRAI